jgi:predicted transcriptional regulator
MTSTKERMAVTIELPADLVAQIDDLAQRELLSRAAWLRREALLAVRASKRDVAMA